MNIYMLSIAGWWQTVVKEFNRTMIADDRWEMFASGLGVTMMIWFFAVILGVVIGVLVAFGKLSRIKPLNWISNIYIDIIRRYTDHGADHDYLFHYFCLSSH